MKYPKENSATSVNPHFFMTITKYKWWHTPRAMPPSRRKHPKGPGPFLIPGMTTRPRRDIHFQSLFLERVGARGLYLKEAGTIPVIIRTSSRARLFVFTTTAKSRSGSPARRLLFAFFTARRRRFTSLSSSIMATFIFNPDSCSNQVHAGISCQTFHSQPFQPPE